MLRGTIVALFSLSTVACGGKVFVDPPGSGGGGSNGSGKGSAGTKGSGGADGAGGVTQSTSVVTPAGPVGPGPGPSVGAGPGCQGSGQCSVASDGSCACKGECSGVTRVVSCDAGGKCSCIEGDDTFVGECVDTSGNACDLSKGCCGAIFAQE